MPSLHRKILSTYGFSKLVMLAFAVVVFFDLFYLEGHIERGQAVTDFREATLEMRRDEKNLFLYKDLTTLDQFRQQADKARAALVSGHETMRAIGGEEEFRRIDELLQAYDDAVTRYTGVPPGARQLAAREDIRELGHQLTEASKAMSHRERQLPASFRGR